MQNTARHRTDDSQRTLRATRPILLETKSGDKLFITHVKAGKSVAAILE